MGELRQFEQPPDYGDGGYEDFEAQPWLCEQCDGIDFRVWFIGPMATLICKDCSKPQEGLLGVEACDE